MDLLTPAQLNLWQVIKDGIKIVVPQVKRIEEARAYRADTGQECTEDLKRLFRANLIYWIMGTHGSEYRAY